MMQLETAAIGLNPKALVIDDDPMMREIVRAALNGDGFECIEAQNAETGLHLAAEKEFDVVLLDVGLGLESLDGFEVCRRIRNFSNVPIIFLSIGFTDIARMSGLSAGANEFLGKNTPPELIQEYVRTVLRRGRPSLASNTENVINAHGIVIDSESHTVKFEDTLIELSPIQFEILRTLAQNPSRVFTRKQLLDQIWGGWFGSDHILDVHISRMRNSILEAGGPRVAHSVRGVGFRLMD